MSAEGFRAGFVALIGLPNVGKSTLLNRILGRKLAIVTPKPQTTRTRILGIETRSDAQYLFVDTPGLHRPRNLLGERMVQVAQQSSADADVVVWVIDAEAGFGEEGEARASELHAGSKPLVVVLNKIDRVKRPELFGLAERLGRLAPGRDIVPVSARTSENLEELLKTVRSHLPESPPLYPSDAQTDLPERFFAAEMIREQLLLATHEEVPYQCAVRVDEFAEREGKDLVAISATILVGRKSHKAIVIGERGSRLKSIGQAARHELERFLGLRVYLELFVKVDPAWFTSARSLTELGL
ncbi:MAG: GTPase Era [Deltaproteobacteria bacterium]|nr:GTPase Era [Deltaproteobacteria bacterium]